MSLEVGKSKTRQELPEGRIGLDVSPEEENDLLAYAQAETSECSSSTCSAVPQILGKMPPFTCSYLGMEQSSVWKVMALQYLGQFRGQQLDKNELDPCFFLFLRAQS